MKKVYIMRAGEYYKIGISENPRKRRSSIQSANPHDVKLLATYKTQNPTKVENQIHNDLEEFNTNGEWFDLTDRQVSDLLENWEENDIRYVEADPIIVNNGDVTYFIEGNFNVDPHRKCNDCNRNASHYAILGVKYDFKGLTKLFCNRCAMEWRRKQSDDTPKLYEIQKAKR